MSRLANPKGFTLLEVLISVSILSVGLLAVASMQTSAISGNTFARDSTLAIQLAEEMVDRIRVNAGNVPNIYNGIDTNSSCSGFDPALGDCNQWKTRLQSSGLTDVRGQVTVTMDSPISKAATITVKVLWGSGRSVTFTTIMETWLT